MTSCSEDKSRKDVTLLQTAIVLDVYGRTGDHEKTNLLARIYGGCQNTTGKMRLFIIHIIGGTVKADHRKISSSDVKRDQMKTNILVFSR